jgi:hypothetical protein
MAETAKEIEKEGAEAAAAAVAAPVESAPEVWKAIPEFEGLYEASNLGRIRSLPRKTRTGSLGGRILRGDISKHGYSRVTLSRDGKSTRHLLHRLVLLAFIGSPSASHEARHLNGDNKDNRIANLAWGTRSENAMDRVRHGTCIRMNGERHPNTRLSDDDARNILKLSRCGVQQIKISELFGVSAQTIAYITSGRGWRHITGC